MKRILKTLTGLSAGSPLGLFIKTETMLVLAVTFVTLYVGSCSHSDMITTNRTAASQASSVSENQVAKSSPAVRIVLDAQSNSLGLSYEVENGLGIPIYIFDRLYDLDHNRLSPDWMYVDFVNDTAMISRQVYPLPPGLIHEEPEVPYGRLLAPGGRARGQLRTQLPLSEYNPYRAFQHGAGSGTRMETKINSLTFQIGWAPASDLHGGVPVELNGEQLVLFGYREVILRQKLSSSPSQRVELRGITVK